VSGQHSAAPRKQTTRLDSTFTRSHEATHALQPTTPPTWVLPPFNNNSTCLLSTPLSLTDPLIHTHSPSLTHSLTLIRTHSHSFTAVQPRSLSVHSSTSIVRWSADCLENAGVEAHHSSVAHPLTHSRTHSLTHSPPHLLVRSSTHPLSSRRLQTD